MLSRRSLILRGIAALAAAPLVLAGRSAAAKVGPTRSAKPSPAKPAAAPAPTPVAKARPIWIGHR